MLRSLLLLGFLWAAGPGLAACNGVDFRERLTEADRAELAERIARTPFPQGLFWEARRGDDLLFLIGTMHIYDPRLEPLAVEAIGYIADSDVLLVEAGPDEMAAMESEILGNPEVMFITDGPTLPEQLDETTWNTLAKAASARGIPPFMASKMQPWFLSLSLAVPPCVQAEMASGRGGLDHMLIDIALAEGVRVTPLEDWRTLFDMLRGGTPEEGLEMLQLSILSPQVQEEMFVSILNSYFAGEVAEVWELGRITARYVEGLDPAEADRMYAETEALLLEDRNRAWMKVIAAEMATVDMATIAVGAAHLPGETGLLHLLQAEGWEITRLSHSLPRD